MALVDYSSGSEAGAGPLQQPLAKRCRKTIPDRCHSCRRRPRCPLSPPTRHHPNDDFIATSDAFPPPPETPEMPPLPAAFHDIYASSVRQAVVDDPSLHHGRKRQTPHVPGLWPSHIYVEWHPNTRQHDLLSQLLSSVETELGDEVKLHGFLTSDLGAPLPLHISLSSPLRLRTAEKYEFQSRLINSIRSSGIGAFSVRPTDLDWYMSPESDRAFLILRVTTNKTAIEVPAAAAAPSSVSNVEQPSLSNNCQLVALLKRCNMVATQFNQPVLYQRAHNEPVDAAFHISIAWTFGLPDAEARLKVLRFFHSKQFSVLCSWQVSIAGLKVRIGNMVTYIPLYEHIAHAPVDVGRLLFP